MMQDDHKYAADPALVDRLKLISHIALDMDGTIYNGNTILACTLPFIEQLKQLGIGYSFVTNNPSKSVNDYMTKLESMGLRPEKKSTLYFQHSDNRCLAMRVSVG